MTEREAARVPALLLSFFSLCRSYEEKPKKNEGIKKKTDLSGHLDSL